MQVNYWGYLTVAMVPREGLATCPGQERRYNMVLLAQVVQWTCSSLHVCVMAASVAQDHN